VLASAATIVAVFLPVAFMGGIPGQFFQIGVTVAVSTIFSTLVARTMTPMIGLICLPKRNQGLSHQNGHVPRRRFQPYRQLLNFALRHRLTTIAIALAFFIGSLILVPLFPRVH